MSLNRVIIMGRLTKDPQLHSTPSGISVANFSLAVDRDYKDKSTGERGVDFVDVIAWRGTADFVSKFFTKGRMAVVEGRLQVRDWTDNSGNKRRNVEVVADNVYFGDSKREDKPHTGGTYGGGYYESAATGYDDGSQFAEIESQDEDLPF